MFLDTCLRNLPCCVGCKITQVPTLNEILELLDAGIFLDVLSKGYDTKLMWIKFFFTFCNIITLHTVIANPNTAFIQAVAYRGTERNAAYQLDARDIEGPLDVQILDAYKFVEKNMKVSAVKEPARHDIPQYAMQAVFEALVNAVAHRDYSIQGSKVRLHMFSDRLEIFSPGAIPNTMTIESLPLRQAARNELLTSLLARCSMPFANFPGDRKFLMDKRGEGVPVILTESQKLSGQLPVYRLIDDAELMLTIFAANPPRGEDI